MEKKLGAGDKRKIFIAEYLKDFNGTRAAREAGYKVPDREAYRLLKNADVQKQIKKGTARKNKQCQLNQDFIVSRLMKLADANIDDFLEVKGRNIIVKDFSKIDKDILYGVQEISETKEGIRLKFSSREKCLELLGRHQGIFNDKLEIEGKLSFSELVAKKHK